MRVELQQGHMAHALLDDAAFIADWSHLLACCGHATAFQAPAFTRAWYRTYHQTWDPVIVLARDGFGRLGALWLLAYDARASRLTHAGAHQAEYQVWICGPALQDEFIAAAWTLLTQRLRFRTLTIKYLPSLDCVRTLQRVAVTAPVVEVTAHSRPLIRLDRQSIDTSFAKKSNKSRFNRLKKLGRLDFLLVERSEQMETVLDDFCAQYDFRQGAVNHAVPFFDDPLKRAFQRELFISAPAQECCVSATLLDDKLIAGFWGMRSGRMVHLGMLAHSPMLAEHSPGKLHIMQLSRSLAGSGTEVLDLTPGGDPWKERFANDHDEVASAVLYRHPWQRRVAALRERLLKQGKQVAEKVNVSPDQLRGFAAKLRRVRPAALARRVAQWLGDQREFRIYRADRALAQSFTRDARVRCNAIDELVAFVPGERWQSRDTFLASALERIERGEAAYSVRLEGRLAHCGWMVRGQTESRISEVEQVMHFPPDTVALYDFYSHPDFRSRGLYRATLGHMLQEVFAASETQWAYISVLADNGPSRHVIESMGFAYQGSFHYRRRFATTRKWADSAVASMEPGDG